MWLDTRDDLFPQLLSFELDTSASGDHLTDPLSDDTLDLTVVLLQTFSLELSN